MNIPQVVEIKRVIKETDTVKTLIFDWPVKDEVPGQFMMLWNFKDEKPPRLNVKLEVKNLENKRWNYRRYVLDAKTPSNMENDRLLCEREINGTMSGMEDDFEILPYGINFIVAYSH